MILIQKYECLFVIILCFVSHSTIFLLAPFLEPRQERISLKKWHKALSWILKKITDKITFSMIFDLQCIKALVGLLKTPLKFCRFVL